MSRTKWVVLAMLAATLVIAGTATALAVPFVDYCPYLFGSTWCLV